jgi:hypothetical protein
VPAEVASALGHHVLAVIVERDGALDVLEPMMVTLTSQFRRPSTLLGLMPATESRFGLVSAGRS